MLRGTVQTEPAMEAVNVERVLAEDLGQAAGGEAARQLHLPQAVLRVAEPLAEEGVERLASADVRNAPAIAHDLDRGAQALEPDLAVEGWQWPPQQVAKGPGGDCARGTRGDSEAVQPERHYGVRSGFRVPRSACRTSPRRAAAQPKPGTRNAEPGTFTRRRMCRDPGGAAV